MGCAKTAETIKMLFGMWTRMGSRKHVLDGVHIDTTWRIRLNHPCVAAVMHAYVKLLLLLVRIAIIFVFIFST